MPAITHREFVHVPTASEAQRQRACEGVATIIEALFEGAGVAPVATALRSGALRPHCVALCYDGDRLVGISMTTLDPVTDEPGASVLRCLAALLPEYRTQRALMPFYLWAGAHTLWETRGARLWLFVPAVNVASYRVLMTELPGATPHPERPMTEAQRARLARLAAQFRCQQLPEDHPLVCRRGLALKGSARTSRPPTRAPDAIDRYFHEINPRSDEGACVMVHGEVTLAVLMRAALMFPLQRARDLWRRWRTAVSAAGAIATRLG